MALDFDFLHSMGKTKGRTISRAEREAMCHDKVLEFMVFNKQEEENGKQCPNISLWGNDSAFYMEHTVHVSIVGGGIWPSHKISCRYTSYVHEIQEGSKGGMGPNEIQDN
jgi:hypothetical protein